MAEIATAAAILIEFGLLRQFQPNDGWSQWVGSGLNGTGLSRFLVAAAMVDFLKPASWLGE
jgi:hypothetical protein